VGTPTAAAAGDLRLPGAPASTSKEWSASAHHQQPPKPAPLPPLKGLTVAEIRAMLGVAMLPSSTESAGQAAPASVQAASVQAAADRYA
jgi:hypothetical protein